MARIETDPNYSSPTFSRATASTDLFKKEDVQALAAAMSTHDHSTGKGVVLGTASIPNGTITSAMIADLTIDTADLKDGAVTSAKILDGTIATADLANASVTNAKLGTDTARLNLLVNGGMEIWQRGNGPFTTIGAWTADRWVLAPGGASTMSASRDTANVDASSQYCLALTYTHSAESSFYQPTDPLLAYQLRGKSVTFSARVRCSVANAVRLALNDGVSNTLGSFHSGGGAYETLTLTKTFATTGATGSAQFDLMASCTAYVDNAMLVVGSVAADYAPLHPADDLARCLRYYRRYAATSTIGIGLGQAISAVNAVHHFLMSPRTAVTPTATVSAPGDWWATAASSTGIACTNLVGSILHPDACTLQSTVASGLVAGNASYLQNNNGNSTISFEANP
jgi:hypothetical protein